MGMAEMRLLLGNKNYSSWSMRAGLAAAISGLDIEEKVVPLFADGYKETLSQMSPSGLVPALLHGDVNVWDSLAIAEYLAERNPAMWPEAPADRARARSVTAEMHSGFMGLRTNMPMNIRARKPGVGHTPDTLAEVERVCALWTDCLERHSGAFLLGQFTIADCFWAPVVMRFVTYQPAVTAAAERYMKAVVEHDAVAAWIKEAHAEPWSIEQYDGR